MLVQTLHILALFLGLSLVLGLLVAVHDGLERLVARRRSASGDEKDGSVALRGPGHVSGVGQASAAVHRAGRRSQLPSGPVVAARRERQNPTAGLKDRPARLEATARDSANARATRR